MRTAARWLEMNRKLIGMLGLSAGLSIWIFVLMADKTKLILSFANSFLAKYFLIICFVDGGLFFIACGIVGLGVRAHIHMVPVQANAASEGTEFVRGAIRC